LEQRRQPADRNSCPIPFQVSRQLKKNPSPARILPLDRLDSNFGRQASPSAGTVSLAANGGGRPRSLAFVAPQKSLGASLTCGAALIR